MLLKSRPSLCNNPHHFSLNSLSSYQWKMIKGPIVDMNNRFNKVFPAFDPLNKEFSPGSQIIDIFPSQFSFHSSNRCSKNNYIACLCQLDELTIVSSLDPSYALVVTDTSIKNNVATSIIYIHVCDELVIKTVQWPQKLNSSPLDMASIKPPVYLAFLKSLLSQICSIPLEEFLILHYIHSNYTLHPFWMSSENSSSTIPTIQLNSENAQVIVIGHFIKLSIRKLNSSIPYLTSLANLLETSARKANVTTSYPLGRWLFKHQT